MANLVPVLTLEHSVDVEAARELDGLTRGARRGNDYDAPAGRLGPEELIPIGWKEVVSDETQPRCSISRSTSPGSACLPSWCLEKTSMPSTVTSNAPPLLSTSLTLASEYLSWISAAKLVAFGS